MSENTEEAVIEQPIEGAVVEKTVEAQQPEVETQEQEDVRDWEADARKMGWVPEGEWKGDRKPAKFLSAEEFVERGETVIPILKSQIQSRDEQIAAKEKEFADRLARMEKMQKDARERQQKSHEAAMKKLASDMRKAAADGDIEAYDELSTQRDQLSKEAPEEAKPDETPEQNAERVQTDWIAKNDWYRTDFKLAKDAEDYSQWLAKNNPNISLEDNLAATEKYIKEQNPEKFGAPKPRKTTANGHAVVDGGSDAPATGRPKGLASKLKSEELAQAKADVAAGLYKNTDEWAKVYYS